MSKRAKFSPWHFIYGVAPSKVSGDTVTGSPSVTDGATSDPSSSLADADPAILEEPIIAASVTERGTTNTRKKAVK